MTFDHLPLLVLVVLVILDTITTIRALRSPSLREANPILAWAMRHGRIWIALKLAVSAGAIWLLRDQTNPVTFWMTCGVAALYAAVISSNINHTR